MESAAKSSSEKLIKFWHYQYMELMTLYDISFFQETAFPELINQIDKDTELGLEMVQLALNTAAKVLDPSNNFR